MLAYLLGADETRITNDDQVTGKLYENFVAMEVARIVDSASTRVSQYHYRHRDDEVDVVVYTGADRTPLTDRIWAVPVSALWSVNPENGRA